MLDVVLNQLQGRLTVPIERSGDRRDLLVETKLACEGCLGKEQGPAPQPISSRRPVRKGGRECISHAATLLRETLQETAASGHAWMAHSLDWREDGSSGRPSTPYIFERSVVQDWTKDPSVE